MRKAFDLLQLADPPIKKQLIDNAAGKNKFIVELSRMLIILALNEPDITHR